MQVNESRAVGKDTQNIEGVIQLWARVTILMARSSAVNDFGMEIFAEFSVSEETRDKFLFCSFDFSALNDLLR